MIITISIIKGGTGKTTTAAALAQAGAYAGKKILAVDLDPQGDLSAMLGATRDGPGAFMVLHGADPHSAAQSTTHGLDVLAGGPDLATERTAPGSALRLSRALEAVKQEYDYIIIDTPPSMGELTLNGLQAAETLIIPLLTDARSLQGLYSVADLADSIHRSNPGLSFIGTLITRYDSRPKLNRFLRDAIEKRSREVGASYLGEIRQGIAIREAQAMQEDLYTYAARSKPASDYMTLFTKLAKLD